MLQRTVRKTQLPHAVLIVPHRNTVSSTGLQSSLVNNYVYISLRQRHWPVFFFFWLETFKSYLTSRAFKSTVQKRDAEKKKKKNQEAIALASELPLSSRIWTSSA